MSDVTEHVDAPHFRFRVEALRPRAGCAREYDQWRAARERAYEGRDFAYANAIDRILRDRLSDVLWVSDDRNLVTTGGKNDLLDKYFAGSAYTAAFYGGLVDNAAFSAYAAADTMASHAGWAESTLYSNATRIAIAFNAAAAGSKAASAALAFNINGSGAVNGGFVATNNTKGGTTGVLYSASTFSGGARTGLVNGDTLNVTPTLSI